MIRLLLRLFRITDFETCKSCETLKKQLEYERSNNKELTDTILSLVRPKVYEAPPQEITPIVATAGIFSRKRAALEERDRLEAQIKQQSTNIGRPDIKPVIKDIEKMEVELGINQEEVQKNG